MAERRAITGHRWARRRKLRRILVTTGRAMAAITMAVWILAPFYFLMLVALQSDADALTTPPVWVPNLDFSNFTQILDRAFSSDPPSQASDLIMPGIRNSAIVAFWVAVANLALGSFAAYVFARFRFRGSQSIPLMMLATQMVPVFALLVPYYIVFRRLGLTNSQTGIVIAHLSFTLPFTVWLLRSYIQNMPIDLDRQARVDGCTRLGVFVRVLLPLTRPGLISVGLFTFLLSWNDFMFPLILNSNVSSMMVQPAIAGLYNVREQSFGLMAAGTLLAAIPTVVIALVSQRFLIRGLLGGSTKY
ncbi:MAG: multiple sugar transport system permease protein [Gaiellales bacterium]|jgi:multiple sugar transport system permease protein|nr:multiple sugar transport system permease protein [Gaiellales bacterium]